MIYKEKLLTLIQSLEGKITIIQHVANGKILYLMSVNLLQIEFQN